MSSIIFIETDRLILRQWQAEDGEPYIKMNLDKDVMEYFPSILSFEQNHRHFTKMAEKIDQQGYGPFALKEKILSQLLVLPDFPILNFMPFLHPVSKLDGELPKNN